MSEHIAVDAERMKRVIDFSLQYRTSENLVLLFDGRIRACRQIMQPAEDKLRASGVHAVTKRWCVYVVPSKTEDPRVLGRQTSFLVNDKEVAICSLPERGGQEVVQDADFNT